MNTVAQELTPEIEAQAEKLDRLRGEVGKVIVGQTYMIDRLRSLGIRVDSEPRGAFYVWANLEDLPEPFNEGRSFFEKALSARVITVPGVFFDVNPGRRRRNARYQSYIRFSFGPRMEVLERGLDRLEALLR